MGCSVDDTMAIEYGFVSAEHMFRLIASVDLTAKAAAQTFRAWQNEDGSCTGLVAAFPYLKEVQCG